MSRESPTAPPLWSANRHCECERETHLQCVCVEDLDGAVEQRDGQQPVVGGELHAQDVLLQLQRARVFHRQTPASNAPVAKSHVAQKWGQKSRYVQDKTVSYFCSLVLSLISSNSQNLTALSALPVTSPLCADGTQN